MRNKEILDVIGNRVVRDDTRQLQAGEVMVWDSRIAPQHTPDVLREAAAKGAALIVSDVKERGVHTVPDAGAVLAAWARVQNPKQPEVLLGVTGTSGKTSVAWFTRQLAHNCGHKSASIGTLGVMRTDTDADDEYTGFTSPTALKLHPILQRLAEEGITHTAMEISSHALALRRTDGATLTAAGYTNFTQDHLDFHKSLEEYFRAKMRLFTEVLPESGTAVINAGREELWPVMAISKQRGLRVLSVGTANAEVVVQPNRADSRGLALTLKGDANPIEIELPLLGTFQAENIAVALGLALAGGLPWPDLAKAAAKLTGVPGRMELIAGNGQHAATVVDYAHKPDALEKALKALRPQVASGGKLHVVFGCGGDRDATKRPIMGKIAATLADMVYVTDDNPRTENAEAIRTQVMAGVGPHPAAQNIADRHEAIAAAVQGAKVGDIILVAGKGHEQGQIVGREVLPFDDRAVVRELVGGNI